MNYQFETINGLVVNKEFKSLLEYNDLLGFQQLMNYSSGELFRKNNVRSVIKIELNGKEGKKHIFHLKKHELNLRERFKSILRLGNAHDGKNEWNMIFLLNDHSIPTFRPVAFGKRDKYGLPWRSLTLTEHLYDYERVEDYIEKYFTKNLTDEKINLKRGIIRKLAILAKKFHDCGFNHNDFYLGHFFINPDTLEISIIDLQRVDKNLKISKRNRIKDIAQLYFSSTQIHGVSRTDRLRFLKTYLGIVKTGLNERNLIHKIIVKNARIAKHTVNLLSKIKP